MGGLRGAHLVAGRPAALIVLLAGLTLGAVDAATRQPLSWTFAEAAPPSDLEPDFRTILRHGTTEGVAHSAALRVHGGSADVIWFEGPEEADPAVSIRAAALEPGPDGWQAAPPRELITAGGLSAVMEPPQLVIRLGNTVPDRRGTQDYFATVVSVGGWAMASVAAVRVEDGAAVSARKLHLSPLLNRSHLVRAPMVEYADGSFALPVYYEMGSAFGELVRFGPDGRVADKRRMAGGLRAIQPTIVPLDNSRAVAFLRNFGPNEGLGAGRMLVSRTADGGQSWTPPGPISLPNLSAPSAALAIDGGRAILIAYNDDTPDHQDLILALSQDEGETWQTIRNFRGEATGTRYPSLDRLPDGRLLLAYSVDGKREIRAHVFTERWALEGGETR